MSAKITADHRENKSKYEQYHDNANRTKRRIAGELFPERQQDTRTLYRGKVFG